MIDDIADALQVPIAASDALQTGEARRLTGPGLLQTAPGAALEVTFAGFPPTRVAALWHHHARRVLDGVGWQREVSSHRHFSSGISVAITAPEDQLYSATFVLQTAWHFVAADLLWQPRGDLASMLADLRGVMAREANPAMLALAGAAKARGIEVLADEDFVTLGHGVRAKSWALASLPDLDAVDWGAIGNLPLGLITGTNGKTTTTRLAMAMAQAAGKVAGLTSTDMVRVGDEVLEHGDFSGPGGARLLLRDPRLEVGFLELARGGILRRGLPVRQALAAVVTNVAADHLGEYGINTVAELAQVKFAIRHGLREGGTLILNADDPPVVAEAARLGLKAAWFSLDADAPQILAARDAGRLTGFVREGAIWLQQGPLAQRVIAVTDVPIAMGGAAIYNVSNALAAACLAHALGVDVAAIARALAAFHSTSKDNPGRLNEFAHNGARLFVDFAHNPHSIAAVTGALAAVPAKRRFVMLAHAGDRSDDDIRGLARGACAFGPDWVMITELPGYLRGRAPGDIPAILRAECLAQGIAADQILQEDSPASGVARIMDLVRPGDLALLLVHSERDKVFAMLGGQAWPN
ncbi:Mur ligase family protein [Tabrizicola sp.]|uniref:Mur ligase family protein n=1 Tax=Tabrizicola sp. TaxID=2005166 RepID=UPI00286BB042|nr:Mur ligase family protein [Tabrizicola sp.]